MAPKLIALDMDGTLTQHKSPLGEANAAALRALQERYRLVMVGAGSTSRIHNQLGRFPMDVVGCYGMEVAEWDAGSGGLRVVQEHHLPQLSEEERQDFLDRVATIRQRHGFTDFAGDSVEFHASGMLTFALLGTAAAIADKLRFDPDRSRRRPFHHEVVAAFPDHTVFVGGSSSFDIVPRPFDKLHALRAYCDARGLGLDEVVYVGDDYGPGGNDEQVHASDVEFITIDDHRDFPAIAASLLAR